MGIIKPAFCIGPNRLPNTVKVKTFIIKSECRKRGPFLEIYDSE